MSVEESIKSKIRKLFALATSPNQHEAENALAMAQKLLIQNNLKAEDIQTYEQKRQKFTKDPFGEDYEREPMWFGSAQNILELAFKVKFIRSRIAVVKKLRKVSTFRTTIVGDSLAIELAKESYEFLSLIMPMWWNAHRRKTNAPLSDRSMFFIGISAGFKQRFEEEQKLLTQQECFALQLVEDIATEGVKHYYPNLKYRQVKKLAGSQESFNAGYENGKNLNLDREVT